MKTSVSKFILAVPGYVILSMILGMVWHFVFFKDLYHSLGIYNLKEPIIPLGLTSMIIQGAIIAYLYPFYSREKSSVTQGIKFRILMGIFLFSVSTLANAAKIEVTSMSSWILVQLAFHTIQFIAAGAVIGWIYLPKKANS